MITAITIKYLPNRLTPLYFEIYYKKKNYLKVKTVVFKYISPPYSKGLVLWRLEQMRYSSTNDSAPNLERMRWDLNNCCITKTSRWGTRDSNEATSIYTCQVLSEPLIRWRALVPLQVHQYVSTSRSYILTYLLVPHLIYWLLTHSGPFWLSILSYL